MLKVVLLIDLYSRHTHQTSIVVLHITASRWQQKVTTVNLRILSDFVIHGAQEKHYQDSNAISHGPILL